MIASGFIRKIDELGRIVLPMELRKMLGWAERDALEVLVDHERIVLQKYEPGDLFTGQLDELIEYKGKKFSSHTISELVACAKAAGYLKDLK